ncbi:MAG TPA: DNA translocase FtsK 4TM domain-containing protein [Pseudomonadales bacterium]|jgi:S-DNA-T family DNA segregation ATPase FtsK/SpoIIIE|nr:DNA translocase FtsK 4TM domain-containing protein [Pseudomonadales bacterium]HMW14355.1 DNA translocase FtsK 4TM domain-containing protein [Pseudomonadales bacterium]HMW82826.1 DNA translocase FtsK 4TM domain-containing protein [Pseudomonadales bacterium]HMY96418.1 DNA translocase FtsK 4TM domain-containing protein [Pseudomonadales bacterium]HMZ70515.1 DNA translocase FtsK 4TM domain-containing protein [Pseudomonadales bacterium]
MPTPISKKPTPSPQKSVGGRAKRPSGQSEVGEADGASRAELIAAHWSKGARELGAIMLACAALYLAIALLSHNQNDPGWSHTGNSKEVLNVAGLAGAMLADIALTFLGYLAGLLPILLGIKVVSLVRRPALQPLRPALVAVRAGGLLLTLLAAAPLVTLYVAAPKAGWTGGSGGILGMAIVEAALPIFSVVGSTLLWLMLLAIGITLFSGLSWFWLFDQLGAALIRLSTAFGRALAALPGRLRPAPRAATAADSLKNDPLFGSLDELPEFTLTPRSKAEKRARKPVPPTPTAVKTQSAPLNAEVATVADNVVQISQAAERKARKSAVLADVATAGDEALPSLQLLDPPSAQPLTFYTPESLERTSRQLEEKLRDFGIIVEVVGVEPGPVITRYEIQLAPGIKASRITNLARDLARSLTVMSVRVVEVIPGKAVVGIEIPNEKRKVVRLREVLDTSIYAALESPVALALGHDTSGVPVVVDLARMPHLLVAGTTGSGKSVGVNAMLLSMLFKATPQELRMIMIDPKMLELSIYNGIPHLLAPVITDMSDAANGLTWCVAEMERRYRLMTQLGVRNLTGFNQKIREAAAAGQPIADPLWQPNPTGRLFDEDPEQPPALQPLPYIVVVIDEFADMIMIVGKKVEQLIARIAQKARAAGIHLILATQRPSVDVITGLIKANIPTRIAFQVSSKIDSRTIIDQSGAEQLLGHGDMLYLPAGTSLPMRVHGAFVADDEVHRVVEEWRRRGTPDYLDEIINGIAGGEGDGGGEGEREESAEQDPLYDQAVAFVTRSRKASISAVQRQLRIGYNRAARMIEAMEEAGVVSRADVNQNRKVLAPPPAGE